MPILVPKFNDFLPINMVSFFLNAEGLTLQIVVTLIADSNMSNKSSSFINNVYVRTQQFVG